MGVTAANFGAAKDKGGFFDNSEESPSGKVINFGDIEDQNNEPFASVEESKETETAPNI